MAVNASDSSTDTETKKLSFSWGNAQSPLALPILRLPFSNFPPPELRASISTVADHCSTFLNSLASQNPFIKKLLSLSSEFHNTCVQIRCSNYRNRRSVSNYNFAAVLPGDSVAGLVVANGVLNFLSLYNTLIIVRLVLTWFPNAPPVIVSPLSFEYKEDYKFHFWRAVSIAVRFFKYRSLSLDPLKLMALLLAAPCRSSGSSTICDPYLNIFRGLIPPIGGLDLSPILASLVLNAFTSSAAALPAELPVTELSKEGLPAKLQSTDVTSSQKKWMRRLQGIGSKASTRAN